MISQSTMQAPPQAPEELLMKAKQAMKPKFFRLDVAVAERFLESISLTAVPKAKFEERALVPSEGVVTILDCQWPAATHDTTPHGYEAVRPMPQGLDVAVAQRFLTSLEVEDTARLSKTMAEDTSWRGMSDDSERDTDGGNAPDGWRSSPKARISNNRRDASRGATVIGGCRTRSDLDRLVPSLIGKGLLGGRIVMSTQQAATYVCSIKPSEETPFSVGVLDAWQNTGRQVKVPPISVSKGRRFYGWLPLRMTKKEQISGQSFSHCMEPSGANTYDPCFLDDPELRQGKHHTVLRLECYQVSVIPFTRPHRLKEELNEQFRCCHPELHPSMTLSKLRNLRKELLNITVEIPVLDVSTVATAWVYFEKLLMTGLVQKANRKLLAGACLVLAFKFNQHNNEDVNMVRKLAACIRRLDKKDSLNLDDLRQAELRVFVGLEFGLMLGRDSVNPHIHRMLEELDEDFEVYYGTEESHGWWIKRDRSIPAHVD